MPFREAKIWNLKWLKDDFLNLVGKTSRKLLRAAQAIENASCVRMLYKEMEFLRAIETEIRRHFIFSISIFQGDFKDRKVFDLLRKNERELLGMWE